MILKEKKYIYVFGTGGLANVVSEIVNNNEDYIIKAYIDDRPINKFNNKKVYKLRNFIKCAILIIHFLAAYVIFTYSKLLEENNCQCAHSWKRVFLKYYGYLLTGFLGFLFLSLLIALLLIVSSGESKYILELQRVLVGCVTQ